MLSELRPGSTNGGVFVRVFRPPVVIVGAVILLIIILLAIFAYHTLQSLTG